MFISKTKTRKGYTYYLLESYFDYNTNKKSTKTVEKIGTEEELIKKLGKKADINKWLKDYANAKTKESTKGNVINIKKNSRISRDMSHKKNLGYLYLKKLLTDLGLKKISKYIEKKENLKFDFYNTLVNIICNKFLTTDIRTISTYKFSQSVLQDKDVKSSDVIEALKLIAKYNFYIQTELYKNIRSNTECDSSILFYGCCNYPIVNGDIASMLKVKPSNNVYLNKTFYDSNGFPCYFYLEGNSFVGYNEEKKLKKFLANYFSDSSILVLPESIQSDNDAELLANLGNKYQMTFKKINKVDEELKNWALDPKGWKTIGSNRKHNLEKVIEKIESNNTDYAEARCYSNMVFYKQKPVDTSTGLQYFYVAFQYDYLIEQELHRSYLINTMQKSLELIIHKALLKLPSDNADSFKRLVENKYVTTGHTNQSLFFDDEKLRSDEQYDGFYSLFANYEASEPETIVKPLMSIFNQCDYFINRCKDERDKDSLITYDEYLLAHYVTSQIVVSLGNYLLYKTKNKYPLSLIVENIIETNFDNISKDGWIPLFKPNEITDELKNLTGVDLDFQFISLKDMQKIIKSV